MLLAGFTEQEIIPKEVKKRFNKILKPIIGLFI